VPVTAEIVPLFGTETSVPVGQATSPPVTQEWESGTQAGGEGSPTGVTQQATTAIAPATAAPVLPAEQTSTTTTAKALPEDLYDLQRCTVCVLLQFYPVGEAGRSRQVLLSIQNGTSNKEDLPLMAVLDEDKLGGPLPPALQALWSKLEADLPLRKQRHDERAAKQSTQQAAASNAARFTTKKGIAPANPLLPPPCCIHSDSEERGVNHGWAIRWRVVQCQPPWERSIP
jgi:hypothetical protein